MQHSWPRSRQCGMSKDLEVPDILTASLCARLPQLTHHTWLSQGGARELQSGRLCASHTSLLQNILILRLSNLHLKELANWPWSYQLLLADFLAILKSKMLMTCQSIKRGRKILFKRPKFKQLQAGNSVQTPRVAHFVKNKCLQKHSFRYTQAYISWMQMQVDSLFLGVGARL